MDKYEFIASGLTSEMRMSDFLKTKAKLSSALITKVKFGGVKLNGAVVTMRAAVRNTDKIEITFPAEESENIPPIFIPLDIVYEDEYILAVNKPQNMPTHPSKGNSLPTLANAVMAYCNSSFVFRAINRLDRDTSGIVIIAKDPYSAQKMSKSMKSRLLQKKYLALVDGCPKDEYGIIDMPIERCAEGSIKRCVSIDGKPAVTEYRVLKKYEKSTLCEITLHTGRTHQIRVHMAYIGCPLTNDFLYGKRNDNASYFLHCYKISIPHPITEKTVTFISIPEKLKDTAPDT